MADTSAGHEGDREWSPLPAELTGNADAAKARAEAIAAAIVEVDKGRHDAAADEAEAAADLTQKLADTLSTISIGGVDRARGGAQFVQTAASAIAGLYTGVLAALFVSDHAAPPRSIAPMIFLGLAIALATYYLAFIVVEDPLQRPPTLSIPAEDVWIRLNYITRWVRAVTLARANALRAAVVSLFIGLLFLPIALVQVPGPAAASGGNASAITWPTPTMLPDPQLSAILYGAQLEEFQKQLSATEAANSGASTGDADRVALVATAVGLLVVAFVARNPMKWWGGGDT